ncbi:MAG: Gfo/Idh/MocA family oxidoreductase [Chthoniobacteraceae bacterium]
MSKKKQLRIGLIGYGFMGRAHSNAFRQAGHFFSSDHEIVLQAVCGRDAKAAQDFADKWGYASVETDWKKLIARDDIDVIDIATPNNLHSQQAIAAAKAGKGILCEKPLGLNSKDAEKMVEAAAKAKVLNMVWYNYRRCPAVTLAKQMIDAGKLGKIFHYRANFLQDWTISPDLPQGGTGLWRLDAKVSGSGVTGDLLAHCIDTAMWLNGGVKDVCAMTETFIKQRKHSLTGKIEKVDIDDACAFLCHFDNGSLGLFESTRYARGHKALYTFEINGEHMSLKWDLHDLHRLEIFDHKDDGKERGWKSVHVSDGDHPYCGNWWVPGLQLGYEHTFVHQVADLLNCLDNRQAPRPNFKDGLATDYVVDAVLDSAKKKSWEKVKKPKGWK